MPYGQGLLGRWPYQPMMDPDHQQAMMPPQMPQQPVNGGFGPNPTHPIGAGPWPPQMPQTPQPAARAPRPNFGQPMQMPQQPMMPVPDFQMPQMPQMPDPNGNGGQMPGVPQMPQTPVPRQPQPGEQATGEAQMPQQQQEPGGFMGMSGMDWITMGMALMAGGNDGGNWGIPMQALTGIQNRQTEQKRYDAEMARQGKRDAMQKELHDYQVGELKYTGEQRAAAAAAQRDLVKQLQQTNPELAQSIGAMAPEQVGQFVGQQYLANVQLKAEEARAQRAFENQKWLQQDEQGFRAYQANLDRETQKAVADMRRTDPSATVRGRNDMATLAPWQEAAMTATTYTMPRVQRMREIIDELGAMNGMNQPLDGSQRVKLAQWGLGSKEAQGLMQEFTDLQRGFVLEEAQKLKPVSNIDMEMIQRTLVGPDTEIGAAYRMLNNMEREMRAGVQRYGDMVDWMDQGNSLSGKNAEGKSFLDVYGANSHAKPAQPAARPAANDLDALPATAAEMNAAGIADGMTITDNQTGQVYRRMGNQLVPVGKASSYLAYDLRK